MEGAVRGKPGREGSLDLLLLEDFLRGGSVFDVELVKRRMFLRRGANYDLFANRISSLSPSNNHRKQDKNK